MAKQPALTPAGRRAAMKHLRSAANYVTPAERVRQLTLESALDEAGAHAAGDALAAEVTKTFPGIKRLTAEQQAELKGALKRAGVDVPDDNVPTGKLHYTSKQRTGADGIICRQCGGAGCAGCDDSGWSYSKHGERLAEALQAIDWWCRQVGTPRPGPKKGSIVHDCPDLTQSLYRHLTILKTPLTTLPVEERDELHRILTAYKEATTTMPTPAKGGTPRVTKKVVDEEKQNEETEEEQEEEQESPDESRDRDWLQTDGACLICERPESEHKLEARRDCIAEYKRLATEFQTAEQKEEAKVAKGTKKARKVGGGGRAGATFSGHTTTELMEAAQAGKSITLSFDSPTDAKQAAYTLWGIRRRRNLQDAVGVSLDQTGGKVIVGPKADVAEAKPKREAPEAKPKAAGKGKAKSKKAKSKRSKK